MKEILSQHINSVCEIRDMENELLTTGRVRRVFEVDDTIIGSNTEESRLALEIGSQNYEPLPAAPYDIPVKIIIFGGARSMIIAGRVYIANQVFWRINKVSTLSDIEKRNFFRVRVCTTGKAYREVDLKPDEEPEAVPIKVVDISLSGVLFRTEASFEIDDIIHIYDIRLCEDSPVFEMLCTVRRIQRGKKGGEVLYGCSFEDLSEKDENALYSAIFKLQRLEIQKRRKRL